MIQAVHSFEEAEMFFICLINPLSPHDALMHHFTSLKIDLIFLQPMVSE